MEKIKKPLALWYLLKAYKTLSITCPPTEVKRIITGVVQCKYRELKVSKAVNVHRYPRLDISRVEVSAAETKISFTLFDNYSIDENL